MATGATDREARAVLRDVLAAHAPEAARTWLERALPALAEQAATPRFFGAVSGAGRRFGDERPALSAGEHAALAGLGLCAPGAWSLADLARAALLLRAVFLLPAERQVALATDVYRKGDSSERVSLLRCLPLFPEPARFVPLAIEACRTNVLPELLAVAHANPIVGYFPEPSFNQLVMKVLFNDQSLSPVSELRARVGPELLRMARDFASERRAAGRPLPQDLPALLAMEATP